jgi:hypothetical protein
MTTLSRRGFLLAAVASLGGCAAYSPAPSYPLYGRPVYYPYSYGYGGYGYGHRDDDYWKRKRRRHGDGARRDRDHDHDDDRDRPRDHGSDRDDDRKPGKKPGGRREARGPTDEELLTRLKGSRNREGVLRRLGRPDLISR